MMMEIVVKIEEKIFEELTKYDKPVPTGNHLYDSILLSIYNGIPLPEHHGDLIDRSELLKQSYRIDDSATLSARDVVNEEEISDALTIIEADKPHNNELENPFNDSRFGG